MHGFQCNAKLQGALTLVFACCMLLACTREKSRASESLKNRVSAETSESVLLLPLLESFGVRANARVRELALPMPTGKTQNAVSLRCLEVELSSPSPADLQKLVPLYSGLAASRVNFSESGKGYFISDLLSPAAQAALNNEFQFDSKASKISSAEALFSVLLSDGRSLRFFSYADAQLDGVLLGGQSFSSLGEVLLSRKNSDAHIRERNSGFAVGDLLVFHKDGKIEHVAVWLDHDLYFEALVFARSVLFRLATWSQLTEELALRNHDDVHQLKVSALRRVGAWSETASRVRKFKGQKLTADVELGLDTRGRGRVTSSSGVSIRPRLREPTDGGVSPQGSRQ
jgi:hypothetical protein